MYRELHGDVNKEVHAYHDHSASNYGKHWRGLVSRPCACGWLESASTIDDANLPNIQADHDEVLRNREADRKDEVVKWLTSFFQSPVFCSTLITSPVERGITATISVISSTA